METKPQPLTKAEVENPPGVTYSTIDKVDRARLLATVDALDEARVTIDAVKREADEARADLKRVSENRAELVEHVAALREHVSALETQVAELNLEVAATETRLEAQCLLADAREVRAEVAERGCQSLRAELEAERGQTERVWRKALMGAAKAASSLCDSVAHGSSDRPDVQNALWLLGDSIAARIGSLVALAPPATTADAKETPP